MAYEEYFDLYLEAQKKDDAPYYMVSFDVIGSQQMTAEENIKMHENHTIIMKYVYAKLLESEKALNRQVVIKDDRFFKPWEPRVSGWTWNGNYMDPFSIGDCFQFTVFRDTVSKDQIIEWVNECAKELNMNEQFHIADGYYETNDYGEGGTKFFRGYCIQTLETIHKPWVKQQLKNVKRRLKRLEMKNKKTSET